LAWWCVAVRRGLVGLWLLAMDPRWLDLLDLRLTCADECLALESNWTLTNRCLPISISNDAPVRLKQSLFGTVEFQNVWGPSAEFVGIRDSGLG